MVRGVPRLRRYEAVSLAKDTSPHKSRSSDPLGRIRETGLLVGRLGEGGLENGVRLKAIREGTNEGSHGRMQEAPKAEGKHFRCGLIGRPVIKGNAVGGDEYAGAVLTIFAVNENLLRRRFAEKSEELGELRGSGIGKSADGNRNKTNAKRLGAGTLLIAGVRRFATQVDNGGDAEFFEFG